MTRPILRKNFVVGISMVDTKRRLKLSALETILMECASFHSGEMGLGIESTDRQNITWVLSKMRFEIEKLPEVWDEILVETWPLVPNGKIAFDRDFLVFDKAGKIVVKATSRWCLIDIDKRRPVAREAVEYFPPKYDERQLFEPMFFELRTPSAGAEQREHTIAYSDLDFNGHVTNTKYFDIVLDMLEKNVVENMNIGAVEIHFVSEALPQNGFFVDFEKQENNWIFEGKTQNGKRIFLMNILEK